MNDAEQTTRSEEATPRRAGIFSRRWLRFCAACALGLVALAPQAHLWAKRGRAWAGGCASIHPDEAAYQAYVNALIDGRPRRSDPYTGRDEELDAGRVESIFSVQFLPAYAVALPARLLRVSAATAFIALAFLSAFLSTLALDRLLFALLEDECAAAAGALFTLCSGALARAQRLVQWLTGNFTPFFSTPFLRRYEPAASFPVFFLLCLCAWRALASERRRDALLWSAATGACFAALVFSYFFLWTAALAWLACLAALWLAFRRDERRRASLVFGVVACCALAALAPYALLLSRRAPSTDAAQLLVSTRAPDLFRPPELLGLAVVAAVVLAARRRLLDARAPSLLFALAFALTPLVVFNQQIVTARSLQPIHYEQFITNYLAPLAAFVVAWLVWREHPARGRSFAPQTRRALAALAALSLCVGLAETLWMTRRFAAANVLRDTFVPAARRLREEAARVGSIADARRALVFCFEPGVCDHLPSFAPQPVLWGGHMPSSPGVSPRENKERLYLQLYYSGVDRDKFASLVHSSRDYRMSLFGWGRGIAGLAADRQEITGEDERAEIESYARFAADFDRARAASPRLSYAVVRADGGARLDDLDHWYERDAGVRAGDFTIYRVRLKGEQ